MTASGMIAIIKSNKRKRVSAIEKLKKYNFKEKGKLYFKNKATPKLLNKIRKQALKDAKRDTLINYAVYTLISVSTLLLTGIIKF
ncbi:hypothetical protein [Tenacibaculum sp. M341]|uniref:hypothetical protein n=1 Tax=Tenacibaculum sp. M341 TaxID=2530339 RepID=UPI00104A90A9|nr:hypothetical protein [Tenacibaculum sp. M341]TCI93659.1 hypothetical protein EYW44_04395 [Tenacibaculum sp. M341]